MRDRGISRAARPVLLGMAALLFASGPAFAAPVRVAVNGQPVYFAGAQPAQINGRVFIPLRNVAESLDANVTWNPVTRTVHGSRAGRTFTLPIGSHTAYVNGSPIYLDAPARITSGRTIVPLRFAAEALGADVTWHPATRLVAVNLPGEGVAGVRDELNQVTVPADTVVRVKLDEKITSRKARVGDRFTATLAAEDRSRFPMGTRFEGRITEAQTATSDRPGVIDMTFDRAILPDGTVVPISGNLSGLGQESVAQAEDGRLVTRRREARNGGFDWKWVGIGAAGGAVLGEIFGDELLKGALLGALGGAIYAYINRERGGDREFHEVVLPAGTEFGVHLNERVAFAERDGYRYP